MVLRQWDYEHRYSLHSDTMAVQQGGLGIRRRNAGDDREMNHACGGCCVLGRWL